MAERVLPKGYRWIEPGEILQEGDLAVERDGGTFTPMAIGKSCMFAQLYARPLPKPPQGRRWVALGEILKAGDQFEDNGCYITIQDNIVGQEANMEYTYFRADPFPNALKEPVEMKVSFTWGTPPTQFTETQIDPLDYLVMSGIINVSEVPKTDYQLELQCKPHDEPVKAKPTLSVGDWVRIRKHLDHQCFLSDMDDQDGLIGQIDEVGDDVFSVRTKTGHWWYTPQCLTKLLDPGEGYRFLDPSEKVEKGDECFYLPRPEWGWFPSHNWQREHCGRQSINHIYRRKFVVAIPAPVSAPATPEPQPYKLPSADDIGKRVVVIERLSGYESRSVGYLVKYVARIDRPDIVEVGVSATPADSFTNLYFLHKTDKNQQFEIVVLEDSKHE